MDPRVRRWMAGFPTEEQSVHRHVEPYRKATPQELDWAIDQACALAEELARSRPDPESLFLQQTPRSAESEALWLRLVQEARRERKPPAT